MKVVLYQALFMMGGLASPHDHTEHAAGSHNPQAKGIIALVPIELVVCRFNV